MSQNKMPGWVIPTVIAGVFLVVVMMVFFSAVGIKNRAVELRTQFSAQESANKTVYDEMWKVLSQQAQVSQQYAEDFSKTYTKLMGARYEGKDPLFSFIKESNPNFSPEMYKGLSQSIEAQRSKFTRVQKKMVDIKREHDNMRLKFPSSFFMNMYGEKELELKLVLSTRTEEVFETGKDDNVDLFK
jgi:hypothetical protein